MKFDIRNKKNILIILNISLILVIVFVVYQKFLKSYKEIIFDCSYNSKSTELTEIIEKNFFDIEKRDLQFIAIFNDFPHPHELEIFNRVCHKYKNRLNGFALILKKHKHDSQSNITNKNYTNTRFTCEREDSILDKNFFLILFEGHLIHAQKHFAISDIIYIVEKRLNPSKTYKDYTISKENLEQKIFNRVKRGQIQLFDIYSNKDVFFDNFLNFTKAYFIHSNCSSCELKTMFSTVKLQGFLDEERIVIIFSGLAGIYELSSLRKEMNVTLPIYVDTNDEFDIMSLITNPRHNPVTINIKNNIYEKEKK